MMMNRTLIYSYDGTPESCIHSHLALPIQTNIANLEASHYPRNCGSDEYDKPGNEYRHGDFALGVAQNCLRNRCVASKIHKLFANSVPGAPGVGKGTQCSRLALDLGLTHISYGDLLRAQRADPSSKLAHLRPEDLVPDDLAVETIKECIEGYRGTGVSCFLVDGFPRSAGMAELFEKEVRIEEVCEW